MAQWCSVATLRCVISEDEGSDGSARDTTLCKGAGCCPSEAVVCGLPKVLGALISRRRLINTCELRVLDGFVKAEF
eukprot:4831244-Amphidinium_carterae.1